MWHAVHDAAVAKGVSKEIAERRANIAAAGYDRMRVRAAAKRGWKWVKKFLSNMVFWLCMAGIVLGGVGLASWASYAAYQEVSDDYAGVDPNAARDAAEKALIEYTHSSGDLVALSGAHLLAQTRERILDNEVWLLRYRMASGNLICFYIWDKHNGMDGSKEDEDQVRLMETCP